MRLQRVALLPSATVLLSAAAAACHSLEVVSCSTLRCSRNRRSFSAQNRPQQVAAPMTVNRAFQLMALDKTNIEASVVKERYRQLAKTLHPDTEGGSDEAFTELQSAYETCLNYLLVLRNAIDAAQARASDPTYAARRKAPSAPTDSFDPNAHLYQEHAHVAQRRYLNFEGVGYGTQSQRQRAYAIHRLERAFDRVSEYRANRLFDAASDDFDRERQRGKPASKEEEQAHAVAQVAMKHQRQAKRKASEVRKVEEMIDAAMVDWATEAPTLSAFGRPFTPSELMMGASSQDILTQRMNRIMKNAGYVPEWLELETTIRERYDEAVRDLTTRWNTSREVHALFMRIHPDAAPRPPDRPRYIDYADHFRRVTALSSPRELYGERWVLHSGDFLAEIKSINASVGRFNLIVPITSKQRVLYQALNVLEHVQQYAPDLHQASDERQSQFTYGGVAAGGAKLTPGLVLGLTLPVVGIIGSTMYLVARQKRLQNIRAE